MTRPLRGCLVSSCGGHLTELLAVADSFRSEKCIFVLNRRILLPPLLKNKSIFIRHSERDFVFFCNLLEAWLILRRFRPDFILSTGAGPAIPFFIIGKLMAIRMIYIETLASVTKPSLTARLAYPLADRFYVRNPSMLKFFPEAIVVNDL